MTPAALAALVDRALRPASPATIVVHPGRRPIRRVLLALDADAVHFALDADVDAVIAHRHWRLDPVRWPRDVALLANHDGFDRRYSYATAPEIRDRLALRDVQTLAERDGWPLAVVGEREACTFADAIAALQKLVGGIEDAVPPRDDGTVTRIVLARAMTDALVRHAAAASAQLYITGQRRAPAERALAATGIGVLATGHERTERWALARLADDIRAESALEVALAG